MLISDWSSDVCSSDLIAASEFIAALQRVDDADLAKRATALAIAANDENLALQAAQRWLQVEPTSMDAREVIARVALSHRDLATTTAKCEAIVDGPVGGLDEGLRIAASILSQGIGRAAWGESVCM